MGSNEYRYIITISPTYTRNSKTKEKQFIETIRHSNNGNTISFKKGTYIGFTPGEGSADYYGPTNENQNIRDRKITTQSNQGNWGNKNQNEIDFGKDAFSLGVKNPSIYNLKKNTIRNFTLPNEKNLLSFLKENNVQNREDVQIKITKDGVQLIKKK